MKFGTIRQPFTQKFLSAFLKPISSLVVMSLLETFHSVAGSFWHILDVVENPSDHAAANAVKKKITFRDARMDARML